MSPPAVESRQYRWCALWARVLAGRWYQRSPSRFAWLSPVHLFRSSRECRREWSSCLAAAYGMCRRTCAYSSGHRTTRPYSQRRYSCTGWSLCLFLSVLDVHWHLFHSVQRCRPAYCSQWCKVQWVLCDRCHHPFTAVSLRQVPVCCLPNWNRLRECYLPALCWLLAASSA